MIREQTRLKHKKYVHPVVHKKSCLVIIIGQSPGALKSIISNDSMQKLKHYSHHNFSRHNEITLEI